MKIKIGRVLLLTLAGLSCVAGRNAFAAPADWAEEMNALPGAEWGLHDDFQSPAFKSAITLVDSNGSPGTGVWKQPGGQLGGGSQGMALVSGNDNPINAIASMVSPTAQFTAEIRYKIVSPVSLLGDGDDALWFNVGSGWLVGDSGADIRMFEGSYDSGAHNFYSISGEGFLGSSPGIDQVPAAAFGGSPRGQWSTLRLIQDEVANTQQVYVNGVLVSTQDTSGYNRANGFTRGLAFGYYNHPSSNDYSEVHYDYIRIASGIVPIGEAITAVPEPAAGLLTLVAASCGLAARRRRA